MIVTCVYITVKPGFENDFINATSENRSFSVKEPGNLRFDFIEKSDESNRFMLYEAYESEEAAASHKNTAHYLKWRDTVSEMMAEPRTGVRYDILEPVNKEEW